MTIKQFIQKAIEGGWEVKKATALIKLELSVIPEVVLLDPLAWQAVGKVEEWNSAKTSQDPWDSQMIAMTQALIEGKTIDEFLKTL